ncbi:uncharacterized protein LOC107769572 [Nicotiana tabacum]|uniref:Uncharacterized protein LOC107769572 n=1 Tax=Nicotiana tabacum TaxID=4097 RepID=A0A1S3XWN9_TOBAC|nr:PREDICTED: uncharacterized protein LOC107769572 [Nicotiana tabacum]
MSGFRNNGVMHLLYIYRFRFHAFYSTAAADSHTKHLVETLVNSLGFSTEEAISTSVKVSRLRPRKYKPLLVFNFFEKSGLDKTHIKKLVSSVPALMLCDVNKHLKPKIEVLQELGFSVSDLVQIISNSGKFFTTRVDCYTRPNVDYLRKLLGNDDSVVKIIKRNHMVLAYALHEVMPPNISFLQNIGLSCVDIEKLMFWNPVLLVQKTEWLEDVVSRVEKKYHISRGCPMFLYGIYALASLKESTLEKKFGIFRSFGWSDSDIFTLVQKHPACFSKSEDKLKNALSFFMKELGYESNYLVSHPTFFTYSLEKRIMLRHNILKLVSQKKLTNCSRSLYTVVLWSELKFLESYVLPFKDEMPEVYDLYVKCRS